MPKQNRELKNRVREIRSHGSVRGMGCESHLYSEGTTEENLLLRRIRLWRKPQIDTDKHRYKNYFFAQADFVKRRTSLSLARKQWGSPPFP